MLGTLEMVLMGGKAPARGGVGEIQRQLAADEGQRIGA
jgi:hypothetical protein